MTDQRRITLAEMCFMSTTAEYTLSDCRRNNRIINSTNNILYRLQKKIGKNALMR
jgi:hypothetical protein